MLFYPTAWMEPGFGPVQGTYTLAGSRVSRKLRPAGALSGGSVHRTELALASILFAVWNSAPRGHAFLRGAATSSELRESTHPMPLLLASSVAVALE